MNQTSVWGQIDEIGAQTRLEPPTPIRCAQFPQNAILTLTVIAEKRG